MEAAQGPPVRSPGFYRYGVEEELLDHSPAAHVRRPRLDYESHVIGLDSNEFGALLVAAGLGSAAEHALTSLPALNGLRCQRSPAPKSRRPSGTRPARNLHRRRPSSPGPPR